MPIITLDITEYHAGVTLLMTSDDKIIFPILYCEISVAYVFFFSIDLLSNILHY
jgi:hypothetical protein